MEDPSKQETDFFTLSEFWKFFKIHKKWWLIPILLIALMMGLIISLTQGPAAAPFVYAIF